MGMVMGKRGRRWTSPDVVCCFSYCRNQLCALCKDKIKTDCTTVYRLHPTPFGAIGPSVHTLHDINSSGRSYVLEVCARVGVLTT